MRLLTAIASLTVLCASVVTSTPSSGATSSTSSAGCTTPVWTSTPSQQSWNTNQPHQKWWVNNDAWSGSHGPQTISECTHSSWYSVSNQPDNGGSVETYPDTEYDVGGRSTTGPGVNSTTPISGFTAITSDYAETNPTDGSWDAGYDLWTNNWGHETMIWNQWAGSQAYWANQANGPGGYALTLSGVKYHFFANGSELMFFRDKERTAGSVDILAAWNWEVANGFTLGTDVPTQLEYGTEICSTVGTETFAVNSLHFHLTP